MNKCWKWFDSALKYLVRIHLLEYYLTVDAVFSLLLFFLDIILTPFFLQSSAVLRKEIATLEAEILHLERYLLSLYRTAFNEQLPGFSNTTKNHLQYKTGSPLQVQSPHNLKVGDFIHHDQSSPAHGWSGSYSQSCIASLQSTSTMVTSLITKIS